MHLIVFASGYFSHTHKTMPFHYNFTVNKNAQVEPCQGFKGWRNTRSLCVYQGLSEIISRCRAQISLAT